MLQFDSVGICIFVSFWLLFVIYSFQFMYVINYSRARCYVFVFPFPFMSHLSVAFDDFGFLGISS